MTSIAFAAVEWGGQEVRFGVTILFVAFVAYLAGGRRNIERSKAKVPQHLPTCVKCRAPILGNDYRFRGVELGDPPAEDGLSYEHFPRCP
jgi:hypothetical protein